MIAANRAEYGDVYETMRFVTPFEAEAAEKERRELLALLREHASTCCLETKWHTGPLSPGCLCCVRGGWSCLFINNLCNGTCFYCPTPQISRSEPATNNLSFPNPKEYCNYVNHFNFRGVSISGGEPLMTLERTLEYLNAVRRKCDPGLHLWMYTNGILLTAEKVRMLRDAGLNELRFDISANGYRLDRLELAAGHIPTVTVEIPAIPGDYRLLRDLLPSLADAGVAHLNLHQLRCTPHNRAALVERGYTFLHGPRVTVLESELTALRLLTDSLRGGGRSPAINYCSFAYKNRFQAGAARRRAAEQLVAPHEDITAAGYIRSLALREGGESPRLAAALEQAGDPCRHQAGKEGRLRCNKACLALPETMDAALSVSYSLPGLRNSVSYTGTFRKIMLSRSRAIYAERRTIISGREIVAAERDDFLALLHDAGQDNPPSPGDAGRLRDVILHEQPEPGLSSYF